VAGYPHVTLAAVHAALAYYHDYRDDIHAHMKADEAFAARSEPSISPPSPARTPMPMRFTSMRLCIWPLPKG